MKNPPTHYITKRDFVKAKRYGRRAEFIKAMFSDGFDVREIQKVFYKMSLVQIIAIVRQWKHGE